MPLSINCTNENCIIEIDGDFTIFQAANFHEQILKYKLHEKCQNKSISIEMSAIEEIDSSGVQLLLALHHQLHSISSSFTLQNLSEPAIEAITILNLNELFNLPHTNSEPSLDSIEQEAPENV